VRIETTGIDTIDGLVLEADIAIPTRPWAAAVVAHPHPLQGGDRFNPVVDALFSTFATNGIATVRFDFRGVGASQGTHDNGDAERLDVAAAIAAIEPWTHAATAGAGVHGPLVAAGYSFGALVALEVAEPRVSGWIAVAPPLPPGGRVAPGDRLPLAGLDPRPKLVLSPTFDQFCPPDIARHRTREWSATEVRPIEMTDHFLVGRTAYVCDAALAFVRRLAGR
jgi:alpha/beta superfamily hydrolase